MPMFKSIGVKMVKKYGNRGSVRNPWVTVSMLPSMSPQVAYEFLSIPVFPLIHKLGKPRPLLSGLNEDSWKIFLRKKQLNMKILRY